MTAAAEATTPNQGEKLWAGKYKTPEEMEEAIQGKDKEYVKLMQTHDQLKKTHETISKAPDNYTVPDNLDVLQDEIETIKTAAKNSNLSQEAFEKLTSELATKRKQASEEFERNKKDVGDANLAVLEDYVKKHYPEKLQQTVLKQIISDKDARSDALKHRETLLNSKAPGMSEGNAGASKPNEKYDGQSEMRDMAKELLRRPQDKKLREKLIETARQVGEERFKKA